MAETLDSLGAKFDVFSAEIKDGIGKLNHIVIGNGDPGLCEMQRRTSERIDDIDLAISSAKNAALAAHEIADSAMALAKTRPNAVGAAPNPAPPSVTVNTGGGIDFDAILVFCWKNKAQIIAWTISTGASVWAFCEHFIFKHLR